MDQQKFRYFDWVDYSVFGSLLTGSVCIGIYFGFLTKRKQNTKLEYLLGSRELGVIPLAMSLSATQLSGLAFVGFPAEMYMYGTQLWVMMIPDVIIGPIIAFWIMPVFYDQDKTSMYEYFRKRFSPAVRTFGSIIFLMNVVIVHQLEHARTRSLSKSNEPSHRHKREPCPYKTNEGPPMDQRHQRRTVLSDYLIAGRKYVAELAKDLKKYADKQKG